MLSMGRRRVAGVKCLREISRGAPKGNKVRLDNIVKLYESGEIGNLKTAENVEERLASKTARNIYTDKTDRIYNMVGNVDGQRALAVAAGVRKADLETKTVMVTMILYRGKRGRQKR